VVGSPEQGRSLLVADVAFDFNVSAQFSDLQTTLRGIMGATHLRILLVHDPDAQTFQRDVLFAGHAHEGDNRSIRQAHLEQGKGVWAFVPATEALRFITYDHMPGVQRLGVTHVISYPFSQHSHVP
jgi:hypothetical protein